MPSYMLRKMPEALWRKVKSAAALEGLSIQDYVIRALEQAVQPVTQRASRRVAVTSEAIADLQATGKAR